MSDCSETLIGPEEFTVTEEQLTSIETKLTALLAITVDRHIRDTGIAAPRPRSIDTLLRDAGLSAQEIGGILGKTQRAVQMMWKKDDEK